MINQKYDLSILKLVCFCEICYIACYCLFKEKKLLQRLSGLCCQTAFSPFIVLYAIEKCNFYGQPLFCIVFCNLLFMIINIILLIEKCQFRKSKKGKNWYRQKVHGKWINRRCPPGTFYSKKQCICTHKRGIIIHSTIS